MEKRTPHCQLFKVRALIEQGRVRATYSALTSGALLGFGLDGMLAVVLALTPKDFYKP